MVKCVVGLLSGEMKSVYRFVQKVGFAPCLWGLGKYLNAFQANPMGTCHGVVNSPGNRLMGAQFHVCTFSREKSSLKQPPNIKKEQSPTIKKIDKKFYEKELQKLQVELVKLQRWIKEKKLKVVGAIYNLDSGKVDWLGEHPEQKKLLLH